MTDDDNDNEAVEIDPEKLRKIQKEKEELLASLAGANFSNQRTKVAYILNIYPDTRNSDVTLALKYWEVFQPDIYSPHGIMPKDLFKLERMHYLVRARAKIQNEYRLFLANENIRRFRRKHEDTMTEEVVADVNPRKLISVFADETGKTQDFVIVASTWVLTGRAIVIVSKAIQEWQDQSKWAKREIHFARFGRQDIEPLQEYLGVILTNREFLSFKAIAIERARTRRAIEDVVKKLHEHILVRGLEHEVESRRIGLPQKVEVALDEEQSLDAFALDELKRNVNGQLTDKYGDDVIVSEVRAASSRGSPLVQLADLVAGAINRKLNQRGDRNYKDDMADMVINMLDINLEEQDINGLDASTLFSV